MLSGATNSGSNNVNNGANGGTNNVPLWDIASQTLTMSPEALAKVPVNVRDWKSNDVAIWLTDIFDGADDLPK